MKNNLKTIRNRVGKTQKEVSADLSISLPTYRTYEQGKRKLSDELLIALACYYNCSCDDILGSPYAIDESSTEYLKTERIRSYLGYAISSMSGEDQKLTQQLVSQFIKLSPNGKLKVVDYIDDLVRSGKYAQLGSTNFSSEDNSVQAVSA